MPDKNSFRTIRSFGGSQQGGLEELVCQLAHLSPPPTGTSFIRKEGSGGDAGVECFWILEDGSEHAWQAKFFVDGMNPKRWAQIDESVKTAIKKHPKLRKYYVCVPLDRTDTRATGTGGKQTVSVLDEWNEYVQEWTVFASERGMSVEFEYWGAHEMLLPLQSDDPRYSGRALYWFDSVVLTTEKLQRCLAKQEKALGERYSPEFHVDLPIAKTLDGLVNGEEFWKELNRTAIQWDKDVSSFAASKPPTDVEAQRAPVLETIDEFKCLISSVILSSDRKRLVLIQQQAGKVATALREFENACSKSEAASKRKDRHSSSYRDEVYRFAFQQFGKVSGFLESDFVNANITSTVLVLGEAGSGKSHLLCDFAKGYVQNKGPAVLLLGQHYQGGNPLSVLLDLLDLNGHSYEKVLGAIDAAGEASRGNAVVLFDAINEGNARNEWRDHLVGFLEDIKRFPHISLAVSCRSRFDELLVPEHVDSGDLLRVTHEGFRGHEHRAASIYLSGQGIAKPTTPISTPEFSNPLFLKTCAAALKQMGETNWPKGYQGSTRLFEIYLRSLERVVSRKRLTEINDRVCQKALEAVADAMFPDHLFGLPWDEATKIVNAVDTSINPNESLFQTLLREGALAEDLDYQKDQYGDLRPTPIVRFAYERFCDQFVARRLLEAVEDPSELFAISHPLGKLIADERHGQCYGILTALAVAVPEKFGIEFWDLLPNETKGHPQAADDYFFDTLPFRAPSSFSDRTNDLFDSLVPYEYGFQDKKIDLLIRFATEPDHPWNAELLHKFLANHDMPDRDAIWSAYVAKNDHQEEYDQTESVIRSVIEWATFGDLEFADEKQVYFTLIVLIWFTTTTNRKTRDQATKAAARLIARYPGLFVRLLQEFQGIDDLYVQERLYAAGYGGLCNSVEDSELKIAAKFVFDNLFSDGFPTPHLLLRDYARGIVELAAARGCLENSVKIEQCRPPYQSEWPLEDPDPKEFNKHGNKIEYSIFSDDFGNYTMNSVHKWSPTPLSVAKPETQAEVLERMVNDLEEASRELFNQAVEKNSEKEEARWRRSGASSVLDIDAEIEQLLKSDELQKFVGGEVNDELRESLVEEMDASVLATAVDDSDAPSQEDVDAAWQAFNESLNAAQRESFRWAQGFWRHDHILASFSRKWAKRWVCKHAMELGWTAERFDSFEKSLGYDGRGRPRTERIGKKYQRISLHKFLAHLSDNVHYKDEEGYEDTPKPSHYRGPWQPWERDIDPTHWLRKTCDTGFGEWDANVWWRPFDYNFNLASDEAKRLWCEGSKDLPIFDCYAKIVDGSDNEWYSMRGFSKWREQTLSGDPSTLVRDIWFRINSIVVSKQDIGSLKKELASKDFIDPHFVESTSTGHQVCLREYPWHPSVLIQDRLSQDEGWNIKTAHAIPYAEYEWEQGSGDQSTDTSNLNLYMPSAFMIEKLQLDYDRGRFDTWVDTSGKRIFIDPSLQFDGPSFALFDRQSVNKMLIENELCLVWLIGGEKMLFDEAKTMVEARMVFNTMLWTDGAGDFNVENRSSME